MSNFLYLEKKSNLLFQLTLSAEQNFSADPNTTLIKLRQLGEAIAQELAARSGINIDFETNQAQLLGKLDRELRLDRLVLNLFHYLRKEGNKATHQFKTQHKEALNVLKAAHDLSFWYHKTLFEPTLKKLKFQAPVDPSLELTSLQNEIQRLKAEANDKDSTLEESQELNQLLKKESEQYEVLARQMDAEAKTYAELASEVEDALQTQRLEFEETLKLVRLEAEQNKSEVQSQNKKVQQASQNIILNEEMTRILIDEQLKQCGWEVDTEELTFAKGARPKKGKNKAISEWPTQGAQRADYVLFIGMTPVAVVEAKKENVDVAGKIGQAERYSVGFNYKDSLEFPWVITGDQGPWEHEGISYQIPFVFSANGRPYVKQYQEKSGIWFRDVRKSSNIKCALQNFYTPQGILDRLKANQEEAEKKLQTEPFGYLKLRDYQEKAIRSVEEALEKQQKECLLAMATGTGKTRTIIGLMYRFLKADRFKRILFLVDRTSLGEQAIDSFNEAPLEQSQPLSKIYNVAELGDMAAEAETRIQVATVQAMVKRVFQSDNSPSIDTYDCIIVDEAHRGYTLDQEMTEGELDIRDSSQYLSSYRRVLEYFDSVKIGLTATPAKHTSEIFGKPVYTYSYREAVADDWLIDHEPPIRYETLLTQKGIQFEKGQVSVVNTQTGNVELEDLDDEVAFDVSAFNTRVITPKFNEVICEQLAQEIDPFGEEKTMIFCATDAHADLVKGILDKVFQDEYGEEYNEAAVKKITGKTDRVSQMIKRFKNEKYPSIAITVDLLTTGIDVPPICHLVFLRRVQSRILYEQMIGRATRRCDAIGKTVFKIYDPVDIYASLDDVNTMKPLVKNPNVPLDQLIGELDNPKSYEAPGSLPTSTHADDVLNAINQKVMRILRKAKKKSETKPQVKQKLDELEDIWGVKPEQLHKHLQQIGPREASDFIQKNTNLIQQLDDVRVLLGSEYRPLISDHDDELVLRDQSYGYHAKPEDYLDSFGDFVKNAINESVALSVVINRPKDLTREQLKEIRLLLDEKGYSETKLKTAWRNKTNHDIAASIIGFIRQAALGTELIAFDKRVEQAMNKISTLHTWNPVQKKWLDRIAKQLSHEVIVDEQFINKNFASGGGVKGLDKKLNGQLNVVLDELSESLWDEAI